MPSSAEASSGHSAQVVQVFSHGHGDGFSITTLGKLFTYLCPTLLKLTLQCCKMHVDKLILNDLYVLCSVSVCDFSRLMAT